MRAEGIKNILRSRESVMGGLNGGATKGTTPHNAEGMRYPVTALISVLYPSLIRPWCT